MKYVFLGIALCMAAPGAFATQALVHRSLAKPTGWYWRTNLTLNQIKDYALKKGVRVTDLEKMPGKSTYTAVMVKNSGNYKVPRWWITSGSLNSIKQFLSKLSKQNKAARIIDIEPIGNGKFAIAAVQNSGTHAKAWWWYVGLNAGQVKAKLNRNKARLVSFESYRQGSRTLYALVMVRRTGEEKRGWWYYRNIKFDTVKQKLKLHKANIVDLDPIGSGRYNVVFEARTGKQWWWHTSRTKSQVSELVAQTKSRIVDLEPYSTNRGMRYLVVTVDNGNALERRVRNIFAPLAKGAQRGFYLRKVGGSTLAKVRERTSFIPASSLKALYHFTTLKRVDDGLMNLTTANRALCGPNTATNAPIMPGTGSCPMAINRCESNTTQVSLQTLLTRMMVNSNNRHTQRVRELVGQTRINQVAQTLNMSDTLIQERIGCGQNICIDGQGQERPCSLVPNGQPVDFGYRGTPLRRNTTSLRDFGRLYEASLSVSQLGDQRANFADLMLNESRANSGWLRSVAVQENAKVGLTNAELTEFNNVLEYAWKGGSYTNGVANTVHFTRAGWVRIPFKVGSRVGLKSYVFGTFQNGGPIGQASVVQRIGQELLRSEILKALQTW